MNLDNLFGLIKDWAVERGLDKADPYKQMLKLMEEVGELAQGMAKGKQEQIEDSIGDIVVVLIVLSLQMNLSLKDCVELAYQEIKNRKGRMINGVFVKEFEIPYTKIGVRRFKAFDNCENMSEKEICLKLIKDCGYWFEIGLNFYDENNIADFEKIWGVE